MVHIILDSYGELQLSPEMQKHQQEFCSSTGDEESKFWELFEPTGSQITSRTVCSNADNERGPLKWEYGFFRLGYIETNLQN